MANVTITQLPAAGPIVGTESVPIVQNGQTVQTTTAAIAASPSQQQTFLTLNQEPTLPNSRSLSAGVGLFLNDFGPLSVLNIELNGASGSLENAGDGILSKDGNGIFARNILGDVGISVANPTGTTGNPTISVNGVLADIVGLSGTGLLAIRNTNTATMIEIQGTSNQITVADGNGSANPVISISSNPTLPGTGAALLPKGTTAERPGGVAGQIRFNTDTTFLEFYTGTQWTTIEAEANATNIVGGAANEIVFQTAPDTTSFISAPTTAGSTLQWDGVSIGWSATISGGTF